jgi:hypothetical protein
MSLWVHKSTGERKQTVTGGELDARMVASEDWRLEAAQPETASAVPGGTVAQAEPPEEPKKKSR